MVVTRFCPTPSGYLHHGNLYMAILNQELARRHGGRFEVQIDDSFYPYPEKEIVESILEDLEWLGVCPRKEVLLHSRNEQAYWQMLDELAQRGVVKIRRTPKGCAVARVELREKSHPVKIAEIRASSCKAGLVSHVAFTSDARHALDKYWISVAPNAFGWRHNTFWCSDPAERELWLELDLPAGSQPDELLIECWLPKPREIEVLTKQEGVWFSAGKTLNPPQRIGDVRWWAEYLPSFDGLQSIPLNQVAPAVERLRICFRGLAETESYELTKPAGGSEAISYSDLCPGDFLARRTQAMELGIYQFSRAASDIILGTTHVIRGDELEKELNIYVQCMHALGHPMPVLCHVPHLADEQGEKLSKSAANAPRLAPQLHAAGLTPAQARQWIIDNAYRTVKHPSQWHSFAGQMELLSRTCQA